MGSSRAGVRRTGVYHLDPRRARCTLAGAPGEELGTPGAMRPPQEAAASWRARCGGKVGGRSLCRLRVRGARRLGYAPYGSVSREWASKRTSVFSPRPTLAKSEITTRTITSLTKSLL